MPKNRRRKRVRETYRSSLCSLERLESRDLLSADWRNPANSWDVNHDANVTPTDALVVINHLNDGPSLLPARAVEDEPTLPFFDVNGDGHRTPLDALLVINELDNSKIVPYFRLSEGSSLEQEITNLITLGQSEGARSIRLEVSAEFDTSDTSSILGDAFQIYLVDSTNPSVTILDRGPGTALFSLRETGAEFQAGRVGFDGAIVEIDLTSLEGRTDGRLVFQLLSGDSDGESTVSVRSLSNRVQSDGAEAPIFPETQIAANPSAEVNLVELHEASDIEVRAEHLRFNSALGKYAAELRLVNHGVSIGRTAIAVLQNLPLGVTVTNASGTDPSGAPYIAFGNAIPAGGLESGAESRGVEIEIDNPSHAKFSISADLKVGLSNRDPTLEPIPAITMMPGDNRIVPISFSDPDNDSIQLSITEANIPFLFFDARGEIRLSPLTNDIGEYSVVIVADDGARRVEREVTVSVVADPLTTTRISGEVESTDNTPLGGIPIELVSPGNAIIATAITDEDGEFELDVPSGAAPDAIKFHGNALTGNVRFPFVAEKVNLLLDGRDVIQNVNNVIGRTVYLPPLDWTNAVTINPAVDTTVNTAAIPGASVFVAAGTLFDQQGNLFTNQLGITEVPRDSTPAALPPDKFPDVVVTVQPADMVFSQPAPLTLPNRSGWEPGTLMDLWSINPVTGNFDDVGDGVVSPDGTVVNTFSGGIRNSSWHFFAPPPEEGSDPGQDSRNEDNSCGECGANSDLSSEVELHSGAVLETHKLVTYQSLGQARGVILTYDSLRADPRPIVHFDVKNVISSPDRRLMGSIRYGLKGLGGGSSGGVVREFDGPIYRSEDHFWRIPDSGQPQRLDGAIQVDSAGLPTGYYRYEVLAGSVQYDAFTNQISGSARINGAHQQILVNGSDSPFGAGWGVSGLQYVVENGDLSTLLVDGDGSEMRFTARQDNLDGSRPYSSPHGDFSTFIRLMDMSYRRTMKDHTVYLFDSQGRLTSITDRNANQTRFEYNSSGIARIVDPVGLVTTFNYSNGQVSSIVDPSGRTTQLHVDVSGNLIRVTDPDATSRQFGYDEKHHLKHETDKRGNTEQTLYDFAGRATGTVRKDGTTLVVSPAQTEGLNAPQQTNAPFAPPFARLHASARSLFRDANGRVTETMLDQQGQLTQSRDGGGRAGNVERNNENLVGLIHDGRGNPSRFSYDMRGNLIAQVTDVITDGTESDTLFPSPSFDVGSSPEAVTIADINGDGNPDMVSANSLSGNISVLIGNGQGEFSAATNLVVSGTPVSITTADINGDGHVDLAASDYFRNIVSVLLGNGMGGFGTARTFSVGLQPLSVIAADLNEDGDIDLVTANNDSRDISVLLGDGAGGFNAAVNYAADSGPDSLVTADVNRDGHTDVVTVDPDGIHVSLLLGDGAGSLRTATRILLGAFASDIVANDVNRDGRLDLVTANYSSNDVSLLLGTENGGFGAATTFSVGSNPDSVVTADINGDGYVDLATANYGSNDISVLLGDGVGDFGTAITYVTGFRPKSIVSADVNKDGHIDLGATNRFDDKVSLLLGDVGGSLGAASRYGIGAGPSSVMAADVNGDGLVDLAAANYASDRVSVAFGNGIGGFGGVVDFDVGSFPLSTVTADLNGDGSIDLATANSGSDDLSVLLGNGAGGFGAATNYMVGDSPTSVVPVDVNGDSRLDLVSANQFSGNVSVLLANGLGGFGELRHFVVGGGPQSVVAADVNGDSRLDLATANRFSGNVSVLLGDGAGDFGVSTNYIVGGDPDSIVAADVNEDGNIDLATANYSSGTLSVLIGNGLGSFVSSGTVSASTRPQSLAVADINGDGHVDLVTTEFSRDNVSVLLGNGLGGFGERKNFSVGNGPESVLAADVNGDGRVDLISANRGSNDVSVLLNGVSGIVVDSLTSSFEFDPLFNQLIRSIDELGRQIRYTIDPANGNVVTITRPDFEQQHVTYTPSGRIDTITDTLGRITDYEYDARGLITSVTYAVGTADQAIMRYEYDQAGNRSAMIDENGHRTEYEFDAVNRMTLMRDAAGNVTQYRYDAAGNVIEVEDARGNITRNTYDAKDRVVRTVDSLGNVTEFTYDEEGNLSSVRDPLGHITRHRYDGRNRKSETIDPDGGVTKFRYDLDNNLAALIDPVGNRTQFFYDARNRLLRETDPLGKATRYRYDGADNLIRKTDRSGRVTNFEYDVLDRLTTEIWVGAGNDISYSYDHEGNLTAIGDDFSRLAMAYDRRDRLTQVANQGTPGAPRVVLDYVLDPAGNVLSVVDTINGASGASTGYVYDELDRVARLTQSGAGLAAKRVDFTYNPLSQYESIRRYSDLAATQLVVGTTYAYDQVNRLDVMRHQNASGQTLNFHDLEYDAASRITQIADIDGTHAYSYDDRDQLIGANHMAHGGGLIPNLPDELYVYDANGNRLRSHLHGNGYVTGAGNRLVSDGTYNYEYDAEGNTTRRTRISGTEPDGSSIREFTWDHRNRLTSVIDKTAAGAKTQEVTFAYDAFDRRIVKSVDPTPGVNPNDVAILHFVYDREDVILDFVDTDGAGPGVPAVSKRYLHGPRIDQAFAVDSTTGGEWLLEDFLGTTRDVVDASGVGMRHISIDSFGHSSDPVASTLSFAGRDIDNDVQVYYFRSRYYEPSSGRFMSEDWSPGISGETNLFRYVFNAPTLFTDPTGEFVPALVGIGVGAGAGGIVGGISSWVVGGSFSEGFKQGAVAGGFGVIGGIGGAALGRAIGFGSSISGAFGGFGGGFAGNIGNQVTFGDGCSDLDLSGAFKAGAIGALTGFGFARGKEFRRIAPFGNRTGHPTGELPHYHRSVPDPNRPGQGAYGQGIRRHRPWDTQPTDKNWWDRF